MDAYKFLHEAGTEEAERVAVKAKTTIAYFRQIAYGNRRPSPGLAQRLSDASGGRMKVLELLFPPDRDAA